MKIVSFASVLLALAVTSFAGENGTANKDNPLLKLPSKPNAAHIAKIKALGDNSWVLLGQAAGCKRFPRKSIARGRAWGAKMAYAPDMNGAFFCGTGSHGACPEGYYMDDLWFYDANAHKWICLYPGATKQTKCKLDKNGFEVDEQGRHVPISYLSHAYNNITYDTDRRKYFIFWTQCPWWGKALPQRWDWLGIPEGKARSYGNAGKVISSGKHPLFWDVKTGKWERRFVAGKGPGGRFEGVMEYLPSKQQTFRLHGGRVFFYDYGKNEWLDSGAKKIPVAYDSSGCYDAKRKRVYVAKAKTFYVYDLAANAWELKKAPGQPEDLGATNGVQMYFDTAGDVVLWHRTRGPVIVYDPEANKWTDMGNTAPKIPWKRHNSKYMCWHGFYNQQLNAHFFYVAGDSGLNDANWLAYRYKKAKQEDRGKVSPKASAGRLHRSQRSLAVAAAQPEAIRGPHSAVRTPAQVCTGWFSAASNYKGIGKKDDAKRCLTEIVKAYPDSEWAVRARREMEQL